MSIGNPAGIGKGTGFRLRERDRDGLGLGLSRLRASAITLFWVNTKIKTVMTLFRIMLLSNDCAIITLFKIYLKREMTDPFTFECHYSLLDHVKLTLQS